ncbi:T9SS type A sorting domain-containing protein [Flavobacterium foetidum]|uniref:T9SS type A sorting domain-containing protein n=1 Tax=Flavobacterium foetidum TaxID=2026681 RepID=UPI001075056F|nr:T9SS type A sorting domain-containing protein [Flavobacterium foetidum]KAF2516419.1 T9SS type A sorting domain-containing protein [Flavobacterium foetidum]
MKKNYLILALILMLNNFLFSQTVTLTPTGVNGANVSSGPINLGSVPTSTITLGVKVQIPSNVAVGDQGTLKIYYSILGTSNANIAAGGDGGSLYFGGGKTANASFTINLHWNDFFISGGFIFAEYKTPSGVVYRSSNLAVIKNSTMTSGTTLNPPADAPNPRNITNTLCCNQTIRLGEKPQPITGTQYLNPYNGLPYGINAKWESDTQTSGIDFINQVLTLDYMNSLGSFTYTRSLGYVYGNEYPNKSNTVTVTVVPSPIVKNEISLDASLNENDFFEITDTNPKKIIGTSQPAEVNLNILQNPFHTPQRGDNFARIEKFEWEYTKTNVALGLKNWTIISGENNASLEFFTPSDVSTTEDNYYMVRRIAIYQNIKKVSNTLKIVYRTIRNNNTICCDQTLMINSGTIESPELINGSQATPEVDQFLKYQWQSQSIDNNDGGKMSNWTNIPGATSKDYLPPSLTVVSVSDRRNPGKVTWTTPITYNYRRVTEPQKSNGKYSYSNEINLSSSTNQSTEPSLIAYPNPATSVINIENKKGDIFFNISSKSVTIFDVNGMVVNSNNYSIISPTKISMDVSSLPLGTYFVNFDTGDRRSTKVTFIKSN